MTGWQSMKKTIAVLTVFEIIGPYEESLIESLINIVDVEARASKQPPGLFACFGNTGPIIWGLEFLDGGIAITCSNMVLRFVIQQDLDQTCQKTYIDYFIQIKDYVNLTLRDTSKVCSILSNKFLNNWTIKQNEGKRSKNNDMVKRAKLSV